MTPAGNIAVLVIWSLVNGCTWSQDCIPQLDDQKEGYTCTFSKAIATFFRPEEIKTKPSESYIDGIWNHIPGKVLAIPTRFAAVSHEAYNDVMHLQWGEAVLEFLFGFALACIILCMLTAWITRPEDGLDDRMTKHQDDEVYYSCEDFKNEKPSEATSESELIQENTSHSDTSAQETDTHATDTKEDHEVKSVAKSNSPEHVTEALEELTKEPEYQELSGQLSEEEEPVNTEINSDSEGWTSLQDNMESPHKLKPFRPPPPTVRVFSLHKPHEIPNDVMDALLCLKKACNHDHTKIRLIGPKVIVYSNTKSPRSRAKRRALRHGADIKTRWVPGNTSSVIGEQVLSDEFELEEDTSTVSTQTDTLEEPRTLVIRTEAFMCGEKNVGLPAYYPRGSMTGTLLIAKDSFETKFVGKSWSQSQISDEMAKGVLPQVTCSNVRESIVRSRPDISALDEHFADLQIELGNPQAHSSIMEDGGQDERHKQQEEEPLSLTDTDISIHNTLAASSLNSSSPHNEVPMEWEQGMTVSLPKQKGELNSFTSSTNRKKPRRPALNLAKSLTYLGSETAFYERLSLIVADIAIQGYSTSSERSMEETRDPRNTPPRLSRTL